MSRNPGLKGCLTLCPDFSLVTALTIHIDIRNGCSGFESEDSDLGVSAWDILPVFVVLGVFFIVIGNRLVATGGYTTKGIYGDAQSRTLSFAFSFQVVVNFYYTTKQIRMNRPIT
ncbi:hypothetical protein AVEN_87730-1 [Araneus ventricosus]|uniref:Uncharacterized protein n=1 Tax=Araneus ventricosus TaxID=182803 RepID=A0A4Y2CDZ9_ARAVE|nr:hypothetical protein AVEN_233644-1 [Araneus ventricosus]GBM02652.1 hypothetical protein AVEN_87730-1 [Araneus ventricosus]